MLTGWNKPPNIVMRTSLRDKYFCNIVTKPFEKIHEYNDYEESYKTKYTEYSPDLPIENTEISYT